MGNIQLIEYAGQVVLTVLEPGMFFTRTLSTLVPTINSPVKNTLYIQKLVQQIIVLIVLTAVTVVLVTVVTHTLSEDGRAPCALKQYTPVDGSSIYEGRF